MLQLETPAAVVIKASYRDSMKLAPQMHGALDSDNATPVPPPTVAPPPPPPPPPPPVDQHVTSLASSSSQSELAVPDRFSLETDISYARRKMNIADRNLALVDRQSRSGLLQRSRETRLAAVRQLCQDEFTFKPQMSLASLKIAEALGTTFMARQEQHLEKQRKKMEQRHQILGACKSRLSPVLPCAKNKKSTALLRDKENSENCQLAWVSPTSTPNLGDNRAATDIANSNNRLGVGGSVSLHLTTPLNPVRPGRGHPPIQSSMHLQRLQEGPYVQSGTSLVLKPQKALPKPKSFGAHKRSLTHPVDGAKGELSDLSSTLPPTNHHRSEAVSSPEPSSSSSSPRSKLKSFVTRTAAQSGERLRLAKLTAERAMKCKRVFTIHGPYPVVRKCLRSRDWVEKQYRSMAPHKVKRKHGSDDNDTDNDSDDDDQDDSNNASDTAAPIESDDDDSGLADSDDLYGIMSRTVRNSDPSFIWTCRRDNINFKFLKKDTIVNHFAKNGAFTTKVGLCTHLRNLRWFENSDADSFYPRSYKICVEDEKQGFLEDYRLTSACSILKWVVQRLDDPMSDDEDDTVSNDDEEENPPVDDTTPHPSSKPSSKAKEKAHPVLPPSLIRTALDIVDTHLKDLNHAYLDAGENEPLTLTDKQWDEFIQQFYQLIFEGGIIADSSLQSALCDSMLNRIRAVSPQLDMDGLHNIWIIKPGAKSRGRGIICMNRLEEILKLVGNPMIVKEGKWVVQKYIECPLLIYNTKFDIRQWFLVTDWNPLTIWFYQDCYLRFCTQPFSLDNLESSIHLSNFSVQKNFENATSRSSMLPNENMWSSGEFRRYLKKRGCGNVWQHSIYPGMKRAVIAALQCTQDVVEMRKNSFELYGADFMLTEDYQPWLIEINSSPAMGATTDITEQLCQDVIEDTMKVVLDRKHDRNCDTGKFELAFKQPQVTVPPYIGAQLCIEGTSIRNPLLRISRQRSQPNIVAPRLPQDGSPPAMPKGPHPLAATSPRRPSKADTGPPAHSAPATTLEEAATRSGLAVSDSPVKADPPIDNVSRPDSQPDYISFTSKIEGAWGRTCSRCQIGVPGYKLEDDKSSATCTCRRGTLVTHSLDTSESISASSVVGGCKSPELIQRSGTFVSNRLGDLVTLNGPDPIQGVHRTGRAAFMAGRTRPNVNRQRRENKLQVFSGDVTFPFAVANSLR